MSGYDERLLNSAPDPTREQRQGLYNVDLLKENTNGTLTPPADEQPVLASNHDHAEAGLASKEQIESYPTSERPWYRTKKWIITFVILGIVVVAAVVGGAVGGSVHHHSNSSNTASQPGNSSPSSGSPNGAAPDSSSPSASSPGGIGGAGGTPATPSSTSAIGIGIGPGGAAPSSGGVGIGASSVPSSSGVQLDIAHTEPTPVPNFAT